MKTKLVKAFRVAEVIWNDAHGGDTGWQPTSSFTNPTVHGPKKVVSVGQVIKHDEVGIMLVLNHELEDRAASTYIFVPASNIVSVKELVPKP